MARKKNTRGIDAYLDPKVRHDLENGRTVVTEHGPPPDWYDVLLDNGDD